MRKCLQTSLYVTGLCILSCICLQSKAAPVLTGISFPVITHSTDSTVLQLIDSVAVDGGYTAYHFADTLSHRFHFAVKTPGGSILQSAVLASDFTISNGFMAVGDARKVAGILIAKLKSGQSGPAINKQDLTDNEIPQQ